MSKEIHQPDNPNRYFPSFGSAYSFYQHHNKILLQRREELKHELLITQKLWSAFPNADEYIATKRPLEMKTEETQQMQQTQTRQTKQPILACKPPEIRLSTAKVFRYRPFSIILTMSSTWRESKGLTYEQVFRAVNALKCKKEGEMEEFATCLQCSGKNIIEIGSSNGTNYEPTVSDDKTEMYIFDHCKTNCSSSRDHHKKKLQIVITLGDEKIITVPFSIQAREKKTTKGKSIGMIQNAQRSGNTQQSQSTNTLQSNSLSGLTSMGNISSGINVSSSNGVNGVNSMNINPSGNLSTPSNANQSNGQNVSGNRQSQGIMGNVQQGMGISNLSSIPPPTAPQQPTNFGNYQNTFNPITTQQNGGSNERVALFVFSTCLEPSEIISLIDDYSKYISKIEGFINIRVSFYKDCSLYLRISLMLHMRKNAFH